MGESQAARDLAALKTHLDRLGIPLLVLIVPAGNPEASKAFTSAARQHLEDARMATRNWCDSQGIPWRDVVEELPGEAYDDFAHLRGVEGNRVLSARPRVAGRPSRFPLNGPFRLDREFLRPDPILCIHFFPELMYSGHRRVLCGRSCWSASC